MALAEARPASMFRPVSKPRRDQIGFPGGELERSAHERVRFVPLISPPLGS